ncbi:MAG: serine/threonine protein kinase [Acidobacteriota bacterium]|nr:MAG: serine/threonine protein kinase [Acidobacteriota bacterium]
MEKVVLELLRIWDGLHGTFTSAPSSLQEPVAPPTIPTPARAGEQAGERIGRYKLLESLGEGGFGVVFLAEQLEPMRRNVALKVIKLGMDTQRVIARFEAERQTLALMDHPNIAKVLDAGATETGRPYFVMEYVDGLPITEYCDQRRLGIRQRLELFAQVCRAVQHAHTKGIIQRDLKPSNVLVSTQDNLPLARVIDFGIAKATYATLTDRPLLTEQHQIIGTLEYMSPEQAAGSADIDTRSDVYSLGVLLYALLTGSTPFSSEELRQAGIGEMHRMIREVDPPAPSARVSRDAARRSAVAADRRLDPDRLRSALRGELDWVVMKCLEKDPARRYDSAGSLATEITRHLDGDAVSAAPPSAAYRLRKFVRRHRVGVAAGVTVVAALIVGLGAALYGLRSAMQARNAESAARQVASDNERRAAAEAAKSRAALDFVIEMFGSVDPALARGHDVTVAEVLDPAAANVAQAFAGDIDGESLVRRVLGKAYAHLARYPEALRELERASELRRSLNQPGDPESLSVLHDLGTTVLQAGDVGRARELLQWAWEGRSALLGESHRDTLVTRSVLAFAKQLGGELDEAIAEIRAVLREQERTLGPDVRDTLESMCSLADMLGNAGQIDEALRVAHEAAGRAAASLGADSDLALMASSIEADLLETSSRQEEAAKLLAEVVKGKERLYGADHPETLITLDVLARTLGDLGQDDRAIALRRTVVSRAKNTLGERHAATLSYMNNLAQSLRHDGRLEEAEPIYRRVIALRRETIGAEAQDTLVVVSNLGLLLLQRGAAGEALPLFREALEGFRKTLPPEHWMLGVALLNLGRCESALKDYAAAERTLSDAHDLLAKALGPTHGRTLQIRAALAELYDAWGKPEQAEKWRAPD